MIHIDSLVQVVRQKDKPYQQPLADHERYVDTFLGWDIISGKAPPELRGSPEILDIVGANNYSFVQMEYRENGPHAALPPDHDRIKPLCDLLKRVWDRYQRPMIIGDGSPASYGLNNRCVKISTTSLLPVFFCRLYLSGTTIASVA